MSRALLLLLAGVCSFAQSLPSTLAPTGTLRAAFLGDNPALGRVDAKTGAVTGPVADIVKEIARRAGVPYELIAASGGRDVMNRVKAGTADLGFLAYNAGRAMEVDFSAPWLMMPNTYLVPANSPIQKVADADRAGVHIQAVKGDTQDVFLSANLKNTKVDAVADMAAPDELEAQLTGGKIDAFGLNRQRAVEIAATHPRLRVVSDNFFLAGQAIAVSKGKAARLDAVNKMLDEILAADFVKASIERAGLKGVESAKPRQSK
ncbi:MAG: transporter substrate-binding domain-containing protein [Bryobacteraceae bacterium]